MTSERTGELRVAVHQPDFMPWLGLFVKLAKCDVFVVLDHTENNPRGPSLCKRVKFQLPGNVSWLGVPLVHPSDGRFGQPLDEMRINMADKKPFTKALRSVEEVYRKAPFFDEGIAAVRAYFQSEEASLVERNMAFLSTVLTALEITPRQVRSRSMNSPAQKGELMADLVARLGGTVYVSGDGGRGYQDPVSFSSRGIRLAYNHFQPEEYPRFQGVWEPGLSVVDAIMNVGFLGTRGLVQQLVQSSEARARAQGEAVVP